MPSAVGREIERRAHELYDACQTVKPRWEDLGDVTRSVWIDKALAEVAAGEGGGADVGSRAGDRVAGESGSGGQMSLL